jgi:phospholipid/cholesterol/gamma-HCH transport system permease protein
MMEPMPQAQFHVHPAQTQDASVEISFQGDWQINTDIPPFDSLVAQIDSYRPVSGIKFETRALNNWDSGYLTFLLKLMRHCQTQKIPVQFDGLPEGARRLLKLATTVPERLDAVRDPQQEGWLVRIGEAALAYLDAMRNMLAFIGDVVIAMGNLVAGRARFPMRDFWRLLQDCGAQALPIVSLISVLVGLILAFVGAVQLEMFGAQIYVANLVGLGMAREMGAMMAAVIMAGRTGAAFAAQLGTMQVNEEIDALVTLGISPIEYLVLPRMMALVLMMPLLCVYADLMGIAGGFIVGVGLLDLPFKQYLVQTQNAVALNHFMVGIVKSAIFGIIVALAGCLRGIQSGRSATAVGEAATRAVVTGIVYIVVADAVLTVICDIIGV